MGNKANVDKALMSCTFISSIDRSGEGLVAAWKGELRILWSLKYPQHELTFYGKMSIIKNVHFDQPLFLSKLWKKTALLLKSKFEHAPENMIMSNYSSLGKRPGWSLEAAGGTHFCLCGWAGLAHALLAFYQAWFMHVHMYVRQQHQPGHFRCRWRHNFYVSPC